MDVARLRESFAHVAVHGDELPLFFYSDLFLRHPEVRECSPSRWRHRHLAGELAKIVSQSDNVDDLTTFLEGLGRDHRKFGVVAEHYDAGAPEPAGDLGTFLRAGLDERSVCFLARLSRATRPWRSGSLTSAPTPAPRPLPPRRQGLAGAGAGPFTGQAVDAPVLRSRLLDHVCPALTEHGGTETITRLLHRLDQQGTGAGRQRTLFTSGASTPAFITALARATLSGYEPARPRPPTARAGPASRAGRRSGPRPVRVTAGLEPATAAELTAGWAGAAVAAGAGFSRLPAAKAIRAMIRAATAGTAVTSAVMAQLRQGQG